MYRVVLYGLSAVIVLSGVLAYFGLIFPTLTELALSALVISFSAIAVHYLCAMVSKAPANVESSWITALLLILILAPSAEVETLLLNAGIAAAAIALKYIVVYRHRHIANPAALALTLAGLFSLGMPLWWVGSRWLFPLVLIVSLAVIVKTRRYEMAALFMGVGLSLHIFFGLESESLGSLIEGSFLSTPALFFAAFMLTEPLGMPATKNGRRIYTLIAVLVSHLPYAFGPLTPRLEYALVAANIYTFLSSFPERFTLTFSNRTEVGKNTYEYHFKTPHPVHHKAGQFMEWTLPHANADTRGIRRYFTIASAPQDTTVSFAVRHLDTQSTWKNALQKLEPGAVLYGTQRSGDFTTAHTAGHLVWIAGGIGITPFMSMIRDAQQQSQKLDVTLLYSNRTEGDVAFKKEIEDASSLGLSTVHFLSEAPQTLSAFEIGFITEDLLKKRVPEWAHSAYFISGPPALVSSYETLLHSIGIPRSRIHVDYFPGLL